MSSEINQISTNENDLITTLVFSVRSIPAALYKCLGGFASNGVNITKLENFLQLKMPYWDNIFEKKIEKIIKKYSK